jgi:tetratricopeptide (TPR) repeat protein
MLRNPMPRARLSAVAAILVVLTGCTSSALYHASDAYYADGPEKALTTLETAAIRAQDQVLVSMEQAIALQELGRYNESNRALSEAAELLDQSGPDPVGVLVNDEAGRYRGEFFERVYVHTVAMANHLALQDFESAAAEADRALTRIAEVGCTGCRFPFTRYLAALSFDADGDSFRAAEALTAATEESPELRFLRVELERVSQRQPPDSTVGIEAESPENRSLYVVLLLGRGPQKIPAGLPVFPSHAVVWPEYEARGPQPVTGAMLTVSDSRHGSVELTDLTVLARISLAERKKTLIAKEIGKTVAQEVVAQEIGREIDFGAELLLRLLFSLADRADLRHWSSLPASCQVLRVGLEDEVRTAELAYTAPDGHEVDREILDLPESWTEGPLFITRRMP